MATGELREFIAKRPYMIWYSKDYDALSEESIVQATLNYGDWDDVQELIRIMGMDRVAETFYRDISISPQHRGNYREQVLNFFNLYFRRHAHVA